MTWTQRSWQRCGSQMILVTSIWHPKCHGRHGPGSRWWIARRMCASRPDRPRALGLIAIGCSLVEVKLESGRSFTAAEKGLAARQVLDQRPALLFLGGPPEDVRFVLDRHNATLAGASYSNQPCESSVLRERHSATLAGAVRTKRRASIPAVPALAALILPACCAMRQAAETAASGKQTGHVGSRQWAANSIE